LFTKSYKKRESRVEENDQWPWHSNTLNFILYTVHAFAFGWEARARGKRMRRREKKRKLRFFESRLLSQAELRRKLDGAEKAERKSEREWEWVGRVGAEKAVFALLSLSLSGLAHYLPCPSVCFLCPCPCPCPYIKVSSLGLAPGVWCFRRTLGSNIHPLYTVLYIHMSLTPPSLTRSTT
jgi:hypothetical protein